ncbi:hypothetical protein J514_1679 [Acinetobacter sp. 1396970]|nr:hypothetical protein ACINWC487_3781 [Acinetobacter nosocomialis]EXB12750.1 hypothetical protein J514_1679 [Acinetobacter sp. 1396970]
MCSLTKKVSFAIEKESLEILVNNLLGKSRHFEQFCLLA